MNAIQNNESKYNPMVRAYDMFIKQTDNQIMAINNDQCKGIYCKQEACRNACQKLSHWKKINETKKET